MLQYCKFSAECHNQNKEGTSVAFTLHMQDSPFSLTKCKKIKMTISSKLID